MRNKFAIALASLLTVLGLSFVAAPSANAAEIYLDTVSVANACYMQHGGGTARVVAPGNVMDWRCVFQGSNGNIALGVNLSQECAYEYGAGATANYHNWNDPKSWYCHR